MEVVLYTVGHSVALVIEVIAIVVIAAIRTFLSYFLDREVENTRRLQHAGGADAQVTRATLRDVRPQAG